MSDRVVVLSAGPASHPIGEFAIDIAAPARRGRGALHAALRRAAQGDLERAARRGAQGLRAAEEGGAPDEATCASGRPSCSWRVFTVWYVLTKPGLVPPFLFENDSQAAFFFGEPLAIFGRIWRWFVVDADIYRPPLGHAHRDGARVRARRAVRARVRPLARAEPDGRGHPRPLHHRAELDAAHHPRADLRRVVRPRHREQGGARRHAGVLHRLLQRLPGREGGEPGRARQRAHARRQPAPAAAPRVPAERDELGLQLAAHLRGAGLRRRRRGRVPRLGARAWATSSCRPRARSTSTP